MVLKHKEWFSLFGRIADFNQEAILILDDSFEIVYSNKIADNLFIIDDYNLILDQVFERESALLLTDLAATALNTLNTKYPEPFPLKIKTGSIINVKVHIEINSFDGVDAIIIIFKPQNYESESEDSVKIKIGEKDHLTSFLDDSIKELISKIQKELPPTIISLKNIKSIINSYEIPIWLQDRDKKLIALNRNYANILDVDETIVLGKKLDSLLPAYQKNLYDLINQYILTYSKPVIIEKSAKKVGKLTKFQNVIQIPLFDNLNNIIGILGLIVDYIYNNYNFSNDEQIAESLLDGFPNPIALLFENGFFRYCNDQFASKLSLTKEKIIGKDIGEIFSQPIKTRFNEFVNGDLTDYKIEFDHQTRVLFDSDLFDKAVWQKKSDSKKHSQNVLMILEKSVFYNKFEDNLQSFISRRGKMFDILVQRNPEPIFIYDKENLKFLEVNEAAENLYGYTRDELLQMDLTDLYAPEDIQTLLDSFGDQSLGVHYSKPFRHRKKDGTNLLVEISRTAFVFNDREAHFNIVKDITLKYEQEKQNQMLKAVFAETDLMVITTDAVGFIKFINKKVTDLTGFKLEDLLQSSFASLVIDDDRALINNTVFQPYLKDTVVLETNLKISSGNYFSAEINATPIFDFKGEIDSFTILIKNIDNIASLSEPKEKVKEVVKEVIKEVIVSKPVESEGSTKIPDSNFLSGMFHEILTPINVIIGFSQELISGTENPSDEQKEAAEIINQNRIKMMDTMNSVVEYSDILQNKTPLKIETITITEIIEKLDDNIKDITGINDIQFAYGKISSSLKFKNDRHKFETFILAVIKLVSRISKDKKVYFSAFSNSGNTFLLGISDQYGNPSEYVSNVLENIFKAERDPKDFGLPKLTSFLAKTLLSYLGGKFYRSSLETVRNETGFVFPISFEQKSIVDDIEYNSAFQIVPDISKSTEIANDDIFAEKITQDDISDSSIRTPEPFKPVPPIAEELLTRITEDTQILKRSEPSEVLSTPEDVEYDNFQKAHQVDSNDINEIETRKVEDQSYQHISEEIQERIADETIKEDDIPVKSLDLAKLKCLYIEDQVDSQILFKVQMKELKDVKFAVSFEEAQVLLLNNQFDFIVMDINLQGEYNGLDALKIIKTMPSFTTLPIIAVTAYVLPGDKEKFIASGFDDFISKPIFKEKMIESLERVFLSK